MSIILPRKRQTVALILSVSLLLLALFPAPLAASALTLVWDSNTEDDLAGYKIYYGVRSGDYDFVIDVGGVTQYTVTGLEPETRYYLSLTAYDSSRNESDLSAEVSALTGDDPAPPVQTDSEDGYAKWGCFIATAAYGSYLNPRVEILRNFRDEYLIPNIFGRKFVDFYYQYSPRIANHIGKYGSLQFLTRQALLPLIGMSSLSPKTTASQKLLVLPFYLLLIFTIAFPFYLRQKR